MPGSVSVADAVLYKRTTATAQTAQFSAAALAHPEEAEAARSAPDLVDAPPSREQLEIERLGRDNTALQGELAQLRADWGKSLEAAEARALSTAARQHVTDDTARLLTLHEVLDKARAAFDAALGQQAMPLAQTLAQDALARLVESRDDETEWLARTIGRRLSELRSGAVVELRLAADIEPGLLAGLREQLPPGANIVSDPALRAGTARIGLRLGQVEIDPAAGLRTLLGALEQGGTDQNPIEPGEANV